MNVITENVCVYITEQYNVNIGKVGYKNVYDSFCRIIGDDGLYEQYKYFIDRVYDKNLSKNEIKYLVESVLSPVMNEGFYNPFTDVMKVKTNSSDVLSIVPEITQTPKKDSYIKDIKIWDSNVNGKILCKDGAMYAGINFIPGDIIEECPIKMLNASDMYSKNIRDISFEVSDGVYALPYGYANCYKTTYDSGKIGNIDYDYKVGDNIIKFYAIKRIKPNEELVLLVEDGEEMENVIKNGQFNYGVGVDPIYLSKIDAISK